MTYIFYFLSFRDHNPSVVVVQCPESFILYMCVGVCVCVYVSLASFLFVYDLSVSPNPFTPSQL